MPPLYFILHLLLGFFYPKNQLQTPSGMAYQCTQPSLPPPIYAPPCSTEAEEPSTCADCGSPTSNSHRMNQPSFPPPICMQPCPMERTNACAPAFVPMCCAVTPDPGPNPSAVASSVSGGPHTEQPCLPLPNVAQPCTAGIADPSMAMYSCANAEAQPASHPEAMPAYVVPGSIVSLHPSGSITVRPGPVEDVNASVGL